MPALRFILRPALGLALGAVVALAGWPAAMAGPTLDRIRETGLIRFGYRVDAAPFSAEVDGRPKGFTVELCALVAAEIGKTDGLDRVVIRFDRVGTTKRFEAVEQGEIDVLCGATTATLSRRERVSFSIPTFLTGLGVIVRADAPASLRDTLMRGSAAAAAVDAMASGGADRIVGVRRGTTAAEWIASKPLDGLANAEIAAFDSHRAAIGAVKSGEIDAYFADQAILRGQVMARSDRKAFLISNDTFSFEPYALAIPRGDEDFRLMVDRALSRIYRSGKMGPLVETYFGVPAAEAQGLYESNAMPE